MNTTTYVVPGKLYNVKVGLSVWTSVADYVDWLTRKLSSNPMLGYVRGPFLLLGVDDVGARPEYGTYDTLDPNGGIMKRGFNDGLYGFRILDRNGMVGCLVVYKDELSGLFEPVEQQELT